MKTHNSLSEIRMLRNVTWKSIVTMLVRTQDRFLEEDSSRLDHIAKLSIRELEPSERYAITIDFVWRDEAGFFHMESNTQDVFSLNRMPVGFFDQLHRTGEFSVMIRASELAEYQPVILPYTDNNVLIDDEPDCTYDDLINRHLRQVKADSGHYYVEIRPGGLLQKITIYGSASLEYEITTFYAVNCIEGSDRNTLAKGEAVTKSVDYWKHF